MTSTSHETSLSDLDDVIDLRALEGGTTSPSTVPAARLAPVLTVIDLDRRSSLSVIPAPVEDLLEVVPEISLQGRVIDLVALNYWPEQCGIAPYATQLSEHLAAVGADVTAVVGMPHYPAWRIEPEYARKVRATEEVNGVTLRRLRHFVPAKQTAIRRAVYEATFLAQASTQASPKAELVVAMIPSLGGGVAAARRAKKLGVPFVLFVQDLVGAAAKQSGISGGSKVAAVTSRMESWLLRQADVVGVLNEAFKATAIEAGCDPDKVVILPNWSHQPPPATNRAEVRASLGWNEGTTVVLHSGNMGLKQDLGNVVEAARLAEQRGEDVLFVLMGDGSQRHPLEEQGAGISTLRFQDSLPEKQDFVDALAAADVLLVNEKPTVVDMSLPSKLTSYFCAGRPVLAAVVDAGTTAAQVRQSGGGLVIPAGEPEQLLDTAISLAADPVRAEELAQAGLAFASSTLDKTAALARIQGVFASLLKPA
jgi:colanic acid biosynthesis glycosyl transferase WcaI